MSPPMVTNAVLAERFDNLEELIKEIKGMIVNLDKRLFEVEKNQARSEVDGKKIERLECEMEKMKIRIVDVEKAILELAHTNKILRWLLYVFTGILTAVLIGIATGEIHLVLP